MNTKEGYEVVKFIQHGNRCRLTMDYMKGELLFDRLKREPCLEKQELFVWFLQLTAQLEQYHRCSKKQCYRYLNPYSILISEEEQILLLDLEAESNAFVLKNLQKRSVRQHFLKPVINIQEDTRLSRDLYGLGKTMQFVLAYSKCEPSLTKGEEYLLSKIIEKSLGEIPNKQYDNLKQVQKELPKAKTRRKFHVGRKARLLAVALAVVLVCGAGMTLYLQNAARAEAMQREIELTEKAEEKARAEAEKKAEAEKAQQEEIKEPDILEETEDAADKLNEYVLANTTRDNLEIIRIGEELELKILRCTAAAYDREQMPEKALEAYEKLSQIETRGELQKAVYLRKMKLEIGQQMYEQAALTKGTALEKYPEFEQNQEFQQLVQELDTAAKNEPEKQEP